MAKREKSMTTTDKTIQRLRSEIIDLKNQIIQLKKSEKSCMTKQKELEKSAKKLELLLKTTPVRIINLDVKGNILYINHTRANRKVRDVLGKNVYDLLSPVEQKKLKQILKRVVKTGRKYRYEPYYIHPDGRKLWYENYVAPVKREGEVVEFIITSADTTDQKNAEIALQKTLEELKRSEQKRLLFLKTAPERIINIDLKGKILYINRTEMLKAKDMIGTDIIRYFTPEEGQRLRRIIDSVIQTGSKKSYEIYFISPDKRKIFFDSTAYPIKKKGKVVEILIIATDITEQKRAETALKESEEKFRSLAEQSPNMIFIIAKDRIVYVNKKYEELMGRSKEDYYSTHYDMFKKLSPESLKLAKKNFQIHLRGKEIPPYEYSFFTQNGDKIEAIVTTKVIQYGGETATLGVITDITERKKAERELQKAHDVLEQRVKERTNELTKANMLMRQEIEERSRVEKALRESEEKLRSILDSSPDAITVTDPEATIIDCNQTTLDMLGYGSKEELLGKCAFDLILKKDQKRALQNLERTLEQGFVKNIEYTHVRKEGTEFSAEMSASVVHDASGKLAGFVAITKDISVRKIAEAALKKSESELRKQKLALEKKNIALREIIAQIEIEKRKIEEDINSNVELVLSPILDKLRAKECNNDYINLIHHHLKGLTSSFGSKITARDINLTPREMEICNMIKGGITTKDISKLLNISSQTVERHRKNIRHKLGIANKRINLTAYLRKM